MMRWWVMTGCGLGRAPVASGTFGSAGASVIALAVWGVLHTAGAGTVWLSVAWLVLTVPASVACVRWGGWAIEYFAPVSKKPGDPGLVVVDEFAGQWLSLVALPMPTWRSTLGVLAVQFFLFRVFDVLKPPPARQLEKLPAGWGILADDLAAAVYANLVGQIVFRVILAN